MRALITGASGLLGSWLRATVPDDADLVSVTHRTPIDGAWTLVLDLREGEAVDLAVRRTRPHVVIHAAYAKDEASIVDATRNVASAASAVGAALVHVSTEAVFAGDGSVRAETARPDPVWDYGRWKAAAEDVAVAHCPEAAVVRLPLIVSDDPPDHIVTALGAGAAGEPPIWFTDERRQPALAAELAAALWAIAALPSHERAGTWHLPGAELLSRLEIAERRVAAIGLDPDLLVGAPTPADMHRPRDIRMSADRAVAVIGWDPTPIPR